MPTLKQGTTTQQQQSADDAYSQTLLNTLLSQQTQVAAATGHSSASVLNSNSVAQQIGIGSQSLPSWSDPQIHIASSSAFYDICDFVPHAVDEDLVVGGQGDHHLVIKSGPK